jgi:hypothetical protein
MEPVKLAASEVLDPVAAVHLADRYPRLPDGILPEQAVSTTHIQSGFRATASMPTYISAWPPPDFPPRCTTISGDRDPSFGGRRVAAPAVTTRTPRTLSATDCPGGRMWQQPLAQGTPRAWYQACRAVSYRARGRPAVQRAEAATRLLDRWQRALGFRQWPSTEIHARRFRRNVELLAGGRIAALALLLSRRDTHRQLDKSPHTDRLRVAQSVEHDLVERVSRQPC